MRGLARKLGWRAALVWEKLQGEHAHLPWGVAWRGIVGRRWLSVAGEVQLVAQDEAAGMVLLRVGGHDYWYPGDASREKLGGVYAEIYDPHQGHFYESQGALLRPGDVVLDAGACEGFFVRYALERGARVLVVEPWSAMADCLERTYAPEIARGEVAIARVMLGRAAGVGELIVDLDFPFGARSEGATGEDQIEAESATRADRTRSEQVPITTIDSLVAGSIFGRVDFVKMDIEGAEADALAGAGATLQGCLPRLSVTTYHHSWDWRRIAEEVRAFVPGYRFWLKGMVRYDTGGWRPVMLHAWVPGAPERAASMRREGAHV
jgi:FkbM family methyltransferase